MFLILMNVLYIVLWVYVYMYIQKLEQMGCDCSNDWRRSFIKGYVVLLVVFALLKIFKVVPSELVMTVYFAMTVFFVFVVFDYIHELKVKKCQCSESMTRDVLEVVNYVQVALLIFMLLTVFYVMMFVNGSDMKASPKLKALKRK